MNQEHFLQLLRGSLQAIREPQLYRSERDFQGELLTQLRSVLEQDWIWPGSPAVEQEYMKSAAEHGLAIRPDIIIHCPFDRGIFQDRGQGNYVVIELKRRTGRKAALEDYERLDQLCTVLDYAMGILIHIDATDIYLPEQNGRAVDRLHGFAVKLQGDLVHIQEGHPYQARR